MRRALSRVRSRKARSVSRKNSSESRRSYNTHFHRAVASVIAVVAVLMGFGLLAWQSESTVNNSITGAAVGTRCEAANPWQCNDWGACVNGELQRVCIPPKECAGPKPITKLPC